MIHVYIRENKALNRVKINMICFKISFINTLIIYKCN